MDTVNLQVNWIAVIIAAAIYYILGAIWYSEKLFGNPTWMHWQKPANPVPGYIGEAIIGLVIAFVMAGFIHALRIARPLEGAVVGFWLWLGFVATTQFSAVLWKGKTLKGFFIHNAFLLISFLLMGGVLAAFR